jgi:hypothetical protein
LTWKEFEMDTAQLIGNLAIALFPIFIGIAAWLYQRLVQRLPDKQREALSQFAHMAVTSTEQLYSDLSGSGKKQEAMNALAATFKAFGLPVPGTAALSAAIEAEVWLMHQADALGAGSPPAPITAPGNLP